MRFMVGENAKMAFTTLRENKMRSFLTVLGIVIGITALISVVSILWGCTGYGRYVGRLRSEHSFSSSNSNPVSARAPHTGRTSAQAAYVG